MATQRIPLFGSLINRNSNTLDFQSYDQRFINCYPEIVKNPLTGKGSVNLYKRKGWLGASVAAASYLGVSGCATWSAQNAVVFPYLNGTNLRIYNNSSALIGATIADIQAVSGFVRISETMISNVSNITVVATKSSDGFPHAWFMAVGGAGFTEITDADYPANQATPLRTVGGLVHMDGYAFIMDNRGVIWNSDLNSLANWTATSFVTADAYPDGGVWLARSGPYIVAFGTNSIEFFQNTGNATGSPLTRIPSASIRMSVLSKGGINYETVKTVGSSIYFLGSPPDTGAMGLYKLTGTTISKVSSPALDKIITDAQASGEPLAIVGSFYMHGLQHICLFRISISGSYFHPCLCVDTGFWWFMKTADNVQIMGILGTSLGSSISLSYYNEAASVGLWHSGPNDQDYDSNLSAVDANFTMTVQTANLDQGTQKRKFFTSAELVCDKQSTSGNISISWSDDDFATFSTARTIDPSTGTRRVTRLGSTKLSNNHRRAWKIEETVSRPFRGSELVLEYEVGEA